MQEAVYRAPTPGFVGVFDSGIGGLSVLRALRDIMPTQRFVYLADSAHAPYGERSEDYVIARTLVLTRWLVEQGASLVVNACNTATAAAAKTQRETWPHVPLVAIEPAIKPAALLTRKGKVSVMATRGTLQSAKFAKLLAAVQAQFPSVMFQLLPCDGLAEAIERQSQQGDESAVLRSSAGPLQQIQQQGSDVVVLGCTHYPLVQELLQPQLHSDTVWINPAPAVAQQVQRLLPAAPPELVDQAPLSLYTTGLAAHLQAAARRWLAEDLLVHHVDI